VFCWCEFRCNFDLTAINEIDSTKLLFSRNIAVVFKADAEVEQHLKPMVLKFSILERLRIRIYFYCKFNDNFEFSSKYRNLVWNLFFIRSETNQNGKSLERYENFTNQPYTTFLSILMESYP
jgi:phosphoribosylformylglycinamidine synthase